MSDKVAADVLSHGELVLIQLEENTMAMQAAEAEIKLSCREARMILRLIPLQKPAKEYGKEEEAAAKHYIHCKNCCELGLEGFLETKITCKEAIFAWAKRANALHLGTPTSLFERYAIEHVWGKYQHQNKWEGEGWETSTACSERPCQELHAYWASVPMSTSAGDGPSGPMYLFSHLLGTFRKEGWPLKELFEIEKQRVILLLECIKSGKTIGGHYNDVEELIEEVKQHIDALQKFTVKSSI